MHLVSEKEARDFARNFLSSGWDVKAVEEKPTKERINEVKNHIMDEIKKSFNYIH